MLEIKNVTKTYRPKKGVPVKALDDVSLKFEDKGMVFILGKSGSGKSTLLNVLGGLDRADEGEFIIKGKSSKDFSQSDFDSYRNTFIGFIFQEYNILPEFTVGANIALAMELQGKKATTEALNEILEEVDLTGYGNRKPNELSGGQKQRVAIARALIKKPEMIMADEPTGALDSNTGKQVFDTLKKLSREKLVLVVSHDRDFAELYADRIIELKDGKIISDVSKTSVTPDVVNDGVSVVDDKIIHIKKGYKLTEKDLKLINDYISKADGDTLISVDGDKNEEIKKVVKINDQGGKDEFLDTKPENVKLKSYTKEDSKLIRSRLPYRNSFKIGASSLKAKPVRLVFTIFLCFVAFTLFGLADTAGSYNKVTTYEKSIMDSKIESAAFTKGRYIPYSGGGNIEYYLLNDSDIAAINEKSGVFVLPVYVDGQRYGYSDISFSPSVLKPGALENENDNKFYTSTASGFVEINQDTFAKTGLTLVSGSRLPQAKDEIVITNYIYEHFKYAGLTYTDPSTGETVKAEAASLSTPQSILGKCIIFLDRYTGKERTFTIVGVAETNLDTSKYSKYMPGAKRQNSDIMDIFTLQEMKTKLKYSYHSLCFVYPGVINEIYSSNPNKNRASIGKFIGESGNISLGEGTDNFNSYGMVAKLDQFTEKDAIVWTEGEKTTLAAGEIIVPFSFRYNDINKENQLDRTISVETAEYLINTFGLEENTAEIKKFSLNDAIYNLNNWTVSRYVDENGYPDSEEFRTMAKAYHEYNNDEVEEDYVMTDDDYKEIYKTYLQSNTFYVEENRVSHTGGYTVNKFDTAGYVLVRPFIKEVYRLENVTSIVNASGDVSLSSKFDTSKKFTEKYKVVGYYLPTAEAFTLKGSDNIPIVDYHINSNYFTIIVPDSYYDFFEEEEDSYYEFAIGKMPYTDAAAVKKIVEFNYTEFDKGTYYSLNNEVSVMLDNVNSLVETLSQVFFYVGIFFAVFAALMMYNFISVSINYKKREIGILRAVGARGSDVFGIFFNESLIITAINFVLSSVATFVAAFVINKAIRSEYNFTLTLLSVGIRQFALILGVGVLVAFIGSFLPVMRIARKRPIDAIQNR